ncbi:protein kinase superfamily protein [Actinidia rufa]|uniref:Protein kinase superfamily protein n=1 Tax=Actinidia rufa TaxID=165716 RepID=A0A7J0E3V4_9ERIC|nr:protein kinase superfamily protein [Actinidia rufa]
MDGDRFVIPVVLGSNHIDVRVNPSLRGGHRGGGWISRSSAPESPTAVAAEGGAKVVEVVMAVSPVSAAASVSVFVFGFGFVIVAEGRAGDPKRDGGGRGLKAIKRLIEKRRLQCQPFLSPISCPLLSLSLSPPTAAVFFVSSIPRPSQYARLPDETVSCPLFFL